MEIIEDLRLTRDETLLYFELTDEHLLRRYALGNGPFDRFSTTLRMRKRQILKSEISDWTRPNRWKRSDLRFRISGFEMQESSDFKIVQFHGPLPFGCGSSRYSSSL
jgi:hypothetical protein